MSLIERCNTTINYTCEVNTLEGVAYSSVFLVGFLVNAAALRAFIAKRASWTDNHIYMLNLNIADFTLILFLPFRIYDSFYCLERNELCSFLMFIHFINMYASILTTTAISVQRYLIIRFPLQARSWRRKKQIAFVVCLLIWGLLVITYFSLPDTITCDKLWTCYERCKNEPLEESFLVVLLLLGFFGPLVTIVFCSSQIICILLKVDEKLAETKSVVAIVTANMIVFIVCFTPIHVAFLVNYFKIPPADWMKGPLTAIPEHVYLLASEWIATTNCCFDSISYYFLLKRFYSQISCRSRGITPVTLESYL
ncbi:G-protein coupled receptor 35 [Thunnus maccoyii]|uniref:G-protein coupled receptor 35 n=1 Tax=Thunnus maccoyii TaxID=8240 RepID=UPI001C4B50E0|nr:G-protein coupled receptor 35 [Thunnus maccoyii]